MKKPKHKYTLRIDDSSRLRTVASVHFSPFTLALAFVGIIASAIGLVSLLLAITPLRNIIAEETDDGFISSDEERLEAIVLKLDSLQNQTTLNDSYIANITQVLDITRTSTDSLRAGVLLNSLPVDSLMTGSPAERRFVASMEEKENYNLKVLSPIAAEGMIFSSPIEGGIVAEDSQNRFCMRFIAPVGTGVCAIADGNVVDTYFSSGTYKIIVQHSNGFMSRYSDLGTPLVETGAHVYSGQIISTPKNGRGAAAAGAPIGIEMWHDGTPVYPADYILKSGRGNNTTSATND